MFEEPKLHGDKETVQRKRKDIGGTEDFSSHRPEFFMESRQHKARGRPRHLFQDGKKIERQVEDEEVIVDEVMQETCSVEEMEVPQDQWALRRMPSHCVRKCFGKVGRKNCNNKLQSRDKGLVAPCFWSERAYKDKSIAQWLWFCNHNVQHTNAIKKQVKSSPDVPVFWPIAKGTNVSNEELSGLREAGFQVSCFQTPIQSDDPPNSTSQVPCSSRKRKWRHGISKEAQKRLETAAIMECTFLEEIVKVPGQHVVFRLLTECSYDIHIRGEPSCTCLDFQNREKSQKSFVACKAHVLSVCADFGSLAKGTHGHTSINFYTQ